MATLWNRLFGSEDGKTVPDAVASASAETVTEYITTTPNIDKTIGYIPKDAVCFRLPPFSGRIGRVNRRDAYECFSESEDSAIQLPWWRKPFLEKRIIRGEEAQNIKRFLLKPPAAP